MLFGLPFYGIYKILKAVLSVLREYKILTMRLLNETLVIPIGSFIFLPTLKIVGSAFVYVAIFIERTFFFYSQLTKKYPEFRLRSKNLFTIDKHDREIIANGFRYASLKVSGWFKKN